MTKVVFLIEGPTGTCKEAIGTAKCDKTICCLGTDPAWKGVNSTARVSYSETRCVRGSAVVQTKNETCVKVCGTNKCGK